ncbi:MAG: HAD hydrolase family protein [Promethearchaeota archaeon]
MKKNICCWDLEGPISVLDFAAEIGRILNKKPELNLNNYNMGEFFSMISIYDDYIIDEPGVKEKLGIPEYQPGDTLRIMAPMYVACFSSVELENLARKNLGILPGCKELMAILHENWEVYVISTSYTQFAYNVARELNIPEDHVYCTELNIEELRKGLVNIDEEVNILVKEIFQKYLDNNKNLSSVLEDLNTFFWSGRESDYLKIMNVVKVRGGKRKELAVEEISEKMGTPISNMIALGDSITDINMLQRLNDEGGIAVSFNGNRFSVKHANIAITTPNSLGVLPIFEFKDKVFEFLKIWEGHQEKFKHDPKKIPKGMISEFSQKKFIEHEFVPIIHDLSNKNEDELETIIEQQVIMRKKVRGWVGSLG